MLFRYFAAPVILAGDDCLMMKLIWLKLLSTLKGLSHMKDTWFGKIQGLWVAEMALGAMVALRSGRQRLAPDVRQPAFRYYQKWW